jgi:hypothetical protein
MKIIKSPYSPLPKGGIMDWSGKVPLGKRGFRQQCPVRKLHLVTGGKKFASPWNRCFKEETKCRFVILSEAKDLVFLRFFGRFAPSE